MRRREFISLLGGAAVAWPLAARAQQTTKSRKVGLLHQGESTVVNMRVAAIREGLNGPELQRDLSLEIVVRLADGDVSRLPALAMDLVNNQVDAIVAAAPPAVQAAAGATTSIPVIAIDLESDPVASGFVRSLARPGGNVTGVFLDFPDFSAKCLQLLIESVPTLSGVGAPGSGGAAERCYCRDPDLVRPAPPLRPDMIFGKDNPGDYRGSGLVQRDVME
jgi:putative tryptophan/tyrosine transport system substrate-binding protein